MATMQDLTVKRNAYINHLYVVDLKPRGSAVEIVVNEAGADIDFRVESSSKANAFVVDAGEDRVFLNETSQGNPAIEVGAGTTIFRTGEIHNVVAIDNTDSPYTILSDDYIIGVDTTANNVTLVLRSDGTAAGRIHIIKDVGGNANANPIGIATEGAQETIDGNASVTMNTNYQSLTLLADGSNWFII